MANFFSLVIFSMFLTSGSYSFGSSSYCHQITDGIYVADSDSESQIDGGSLQRVQDLAKNPAELPAKFEATTFQFGVSIVFKKNFATMYRLIGVGDSKFESYSAMAPLNVEVGCDSSIKIDFQINDYYENEINIGEKPSKLSHKLLNSIKIHQEGRLLKDGNLNITSCVAEELRKKGWKKTSDDMGLCNGAKRGYKLFLINDAIRSRPRWKKLIF